MALDVGGKLNNSSTTYHTESKLGQSNAWRTGINQIGQINVGDGLKGKTDDNGRPLTTLSIDVGGNATFNAGQLINQGGTTRLIAQGDVALNAVNTGFQTNAIKDGNNYTKSGQTQDIGSVVASQGSTYIQSKGGSITGTAVTIHSEDGSSYLDANKDITLKEGRATSNLETAIKTTEKSLLSRKTTQDRNSATSDEAISGNVTGDRVVINAGNDIQLTATNAISQSGTTLNAGNNLTLDAAQNRYSESSSHNEKKSGLFGNGGASFTLGSQKTANDNRTDSTTHTGSVVGSYNGNTVLTAGDYYQQTGSKVFAQNQTTDNPKDLNYGTTVINAKSANVTNTTATTESHNSQSQKTTGLTVSVSNSLIDQAQGINSLAKAGQTANSDQMKVMAGVAGFNKLRTLGKGAQAAADSLQKNGLSEAGLKGVGNTRIQATIGSQSSKSNQDSLSGNNEASSIDTNNLMLNIQGKGKDSDFVVTGSDLNVNGDLYNNVEGDVVYQAATGKGYERSSNKSSGFGVGVYADSKNSGFTVNANTAKGYGNGETTTNANSHVTVGGTTYQNIGGDLVLDGAVVKGDHMSGHIDGAILAKSRPDTATYTGKQTNAGVSADIGFNGVPQSVSVNAGRSKVNADYAAVKEQTGIALNSSDVVVAKASRFDGAYFTTATPEANKTVFKEGVTTTDIQNHMNYKGDAINVGLGAGINSETQKVSPPGISGIGYGKDADSQTSTTYGAVTGMAGKSEVTTANVGTLNETLANNFDKDRVNAEVGAQVQITQEYGKEIPKAIGDYAKEKTKPYEYAQMVEGQLNDKLNSTNDPVQRQLILEDLQKVQAFKQAHEQDYNNWKEGGAYRVMAHTAAGALGSGSWQGAAFSGGVAAAAPKINELESKFTNSLVEQGMDPTVAQGLANVLSSATIAGVGSSAGLDTGSVSTTVNIDANNRQLHPSEISQLKARAKILGKGNKDSEAYWLNLLYQAAYAKVDAQGNKLYQQQKTRLNSAVNASNGLGRTLANTYLADYKIAENFVNEMAKNGAGAVYLKDPTNGNREKDKQGKDIGFLTATPQQYNDNNLLSAYYPKSPNNSSFLRNENEKSKIEDNVHALNNYTVNKVAEVGSGRVVPSYPEDAVLIGKGVVDVAAKKVATNAAAKATREAEIKAARTNNNIYRDDNLLTHPISGTRETPKYLNGKEFENWLHETYGGQPSFKVSGREFDGAIGNRWYEAKSGRYWKDVTSTDKGWNKFTSDMGARQRIAQDNGATYELHSNTPIPQNVKNWLDKKGIKYYQY